MKFLCDACGARYYIEDEKVRGKTLRFRCKRCSHIISVRELAAPAEGAAAPASIGRFTGAFQASAAQAATAAAPQDQWYFAVNGQSFGPYGEDDLIARFAAGRIGEEAHVWQQGFDGWKPAIAVPVFSSAIQAGDERRKKSGAPRTVALSAADLHDAAPRSDVEHTTVRPSPLRDRFAGLDAPRRDEPSARSRTETAPSREPSAKKAEPFFPREPSAKKIDEPFFPREPSAKKINEPFFPREPSAKKAEEPFFPREPSAKKIEDPFFHREPSAKKTEPPREPSAKKIAPEPAPAPWQEPETPDSEAASRLRALREGGAARPVAPARPAPEPQKPRTESLRALRSGPSGNVPAVRSEPEPAADSRGKRHARGKKGQRPEPPRLSRPGAPAPAPVPISAPEPDTEASSDAETLLDMPRVERAPKPHTPSTPAPVSPADEDRPDLAAIARELVDDDDADRATGATTPVSGSEAPARADEDPLDAVLAGGPPATTPPARELSLDEDLITAALADEIRPTEGIAPRPPTIAITAPFLGDARQVETSRSLLYQVQQNRAAARRKAMIAGGVVLFLVIGLAFVMARDPGTPAVDANDPFANQPAGAVMEFTQEQIDRMDQNARLAIVRSQKGVATAITRANAQVQNSQVQQKALAEQRKREQIARNLASRIAATSGANSGDSIVVIGQGDEQAAEAAAGSAAAGNNDAVANYMRQYQGQRVEGGARIDPVTGSGRRRAEQGPPGEHFRNGLQTFVQQSVERCNQRQIVEQGALSSPRITVTLTVMPSGRVQAVSVDDAIANTPFAKCLQSHRERWLFGSWDGSQPTTLAKPYIIAQ